MKTMTEILKYIDINPDGAREAAERLHIKEDEIPFVRKSYVSDKQEVLKKERAVISYISTAAIDRDREQLIPSGVILDNYRKNPVVLWGHDYKSIPIGKNVWIKSDGRGLIAKTIFAKNERADEIYRGYTEDVGGTGPLLKAWSVGFIPIEVEDVEIRDARDAREKPKRIYPKWELLEYSGVPIPSCPEALTLAIEKGAISMGLQKELGAMIEKDREDRIFEIELPPKPTEKIVTLTMEEFDKLIEEELKCQILELMPKVAKDLAELEIDRLKGKVR